VARGDNERPSISSLQSPSRARPYARLDTRPPTESKPRNANALALVIPITSHRRRRRRRVAVPLLCSLCPSRRLDSRTRRVRAVSRFLIAGNRSGTQRRRRRKRDVNGRLEVKNAPLTKLTERKEHRTGTGRGARAGGTPLPSPSPAARRSLPSRPRALARPPVGTVERKPT